MILKKIEKPNISEIKDERRLFLLHQKEIWDLVNKSYSPYSPWDKVKYWTLAPQFRSEELWAVVKFARSLSFQKSLIQDTDGSPFVWSRALPGMDKTLHHIDLQLGGNLFDFGLHLDERRRHQLLNRGVMEEAIASSQLEGAHTTRKAARQMLQEGRAPRNKSEHMILNNYRAMQWIEAELKNKKLDENLLLELQAILTKNTLDPSDIGRFRRDEDGIVVGGENPQEVYFIPPPDSFLKPQLKIFLNYANDLLEDVNFVHPVVKAILIHFWIGFLHPFVDGNGRLARTLFYWYLLKQKYWAFGYLPLSSVIKKSPAQYHRAYLYTEQDDHDLTYFLDYNLRKIAQAMQDFESYVQRKSKENSRMAKRVREDYHFNDRQIQLLRFFYKNQDATTSITAYTRVYQVALMTARSDLLSLKEQGFLASSKSGRIVFYGPTKKLFELFEK